MMFFTAFSTSGVIKKVIGFCGALVLMATATTLLPAISLASPVTFPQCADQIDNDNDGLTDWVNVPMAGFGDPDCEDIFDDNESPSESETTPEEQCLLDAKFWNGSVCEDITVCSENETYNGSTNTCTSTNEGDDEGSSNNDTGGGSTPSSDNISYGGGLSGGGRAGGLVLGASTDEMCSDSLITSYLGMGKKNDLGDVVRLQLFLNKELGLKLLVTGTYDAPTKAAVEQFQLKYAEEVLAPWLPYGLTSIQKPTGYVYKTTKRMINKIHCSTLDIPMPQLP